jgi:hypothetical protein
MPIPKTYSSGKITIKKKQIRSAWSTVDITLVQGEV